MGKTSREKGKRGEREIASALRAYGYDCHRGVQYHGGPESPDVVGLPGIHIEVKRVERFNLYAALQQAICDAKNKLIPAVFHRRNNEEWVVCQRFSDWMIIYDLAQKYVRQVDPGSERSLQDIWESM